MDKHYIIDSVPCYIVHGKIEFHIPSDMDGIQYLSFLDRNKMVIDDIKREIKEEQKKRK